MHRRASAGKEFHQKERISKNAANRCMNPCIMVYSVFIQCVLCGPVLLYMSSLSVVLLRSASLGVLCEKRL